MKQFLTRLAIYAFLTACIFAVYQVHEEAPGEALSSQLAFYLGFYAPLILFWFILFEAIYQVVRLARRQKG